MKIVREMKLDASPEEIKNVYRRGHKVAIAFNSTTEVGYSESIYRVSNGGTTIFDIEEYSEDELECVKGVFYRNGAVSFYGDGTLVVMEKFESSKEGCTFDFHPFVGRGTVGDYILNFLAYDDNTGRIADKVVEVEV